MANKADYQETRKVAADLTDLTKWGSRITYDPDGVTPADFFILESELKKHRVDSITSSATPAINSDAFDVYKITAQTVAITGLTITGTPSDWQELIIEITGTAARAITWPADCVNGTATLPTTTVTTKTLTVGFKWDAILSKWACMSALSYV
jgi:hypothetical protein